ncbi:MAG: hypothetical protein QF362_00775 [Candidatus Woesearchaeota archaeon]|jgi:16S rRNA G966 N2-methylase RsmD|nr:hypothetical protein [Candidatus Woesearchaeota archaeon]MDP7505964.1 hypothetical protein [Candidatus Woesearchaeota archaeon]
MAKITDKELYSILVPGHILIRRKDTPRFSPKCTSTMFQKVLEHDNYDKIYKILDPFCGNGTNLTTLNIMYSDFITYLFGSDINPKAISATNINLETLNNLDGIEKKVDCLDNLLRFFRQEISEHQSNNDSAELRRKVRSTEKRIEDTYRLGKYLEERRRDFAPYHVFEANVLVPKRIIQETGGNIDLIFTDPPYSKQSKWVNENGEDVQKNLILRFLQVTRDYLNDDGKLVVIFDKEVELEFLGFGVKQEVDLHRRTGYILVPE